MKQAILGVLIGVGLATVSFASENTVVLGVGYVSGMKCDIGTENLNMIKAAKREAVFDAESKCDWDNGRPVVRRVDDWKITSNCKTMTGIPTGWAQAVASFECVGEN